MKIKFGGERVNALCVQLPNVVLLQELLRYQNYFASHYAAGLDGCGLELETAVRTAYYTLVHHLVDAVRTAAPRTNMHKYEKFISWMSYTWLLYCANIDTLELKRIKSHN